MSIDVSKILEGVKPITENKISRLTTIMTVDEYMNDAELPNRILFITPPETSGGKDKIERYVRLDSLPSDLRRLIELINSIKDLSDNRLQIVLDLLDEMRDKVLKLKEVSSKLK
jgi:hypothetical protein